MDQSSTSHLESNINEPAKSSRSQGSQQATPGLLFDIPSDLPVDDFWLQWLIVDLARKAGYYVPAFDEIRPLVETVGVQELVKRLPKLAGVDLRSRQEFWNELQAAVQIVRSKSKDGSHGPISTELVVEDLLKRKSLKKLKPSTVETNRKRNAKIIRELPYLTDSSDPPREFLSQFNGPTGRYLVDFYDRLNRIYGHAVTHFGLARNPMNDLERPVPSHKPLRTLPWDVVAFLLKTPETDTEKAALNTLLGMGWRPIEIRRIKALDVRQARDGILLCHGKEREEPAPYLEEILEVFRNLTPDSLPDDAEVIRSRRIRSGGTQALGEDGFRDLIQSLFVRAGLDYQVYDLRKTFGTLCQHAGADYFLAERLLRHIIPGCGNRYINYPLSKLVQDLETYSPLRQIKRHPRLSQAGVSKNELVETGESRTPRPEERSSESLQA